MNLDDMDPVWRDAVVSGGAVPHLISGTMYEISIQVHGQTVASKFCLEDRHQDVFGKVMALAIAKIDKAIHA